MSDKTKTSAAIDKAATECVEELLAASGKSGGKPWLEIVIRKMRQAFAGAEPKTPLLRLGDVEFQRFRGGIRIVRLARSRGIDNVLRGPEHDTELVLLDAASTAKLARWLNGGE